MRIAIYPEHLQRKLIELTEAYRARNPTGMIEMLIEVAHQQTFKVSQGGTNAQEDAPEDQAAA